jgi:Alginate lyase
MSRSIGKSYLPHNVKAVNVLTVFHIFIKYLLLTTIMVVFAFLSVSGCAKQARQDEPTPSVITVLSPTPSSTNSKDPFTTPSANPAPTRTAVLFLATPIVASTENPMYHVQKPYIGIWVSEKELAKLPVEGEAWEALKAAADKDPGKPDLSNQDQNNDVFVMAKALVYARTGIQKYRDEVIDNLMKAVDTEKNGRTLALGRNLPGYVIAADLVNLPADTATDTIFRAWLTRTMTENLDSKSIRSTHEERPNNWGTHAGAARAAVAIYLGDTKDLERTALVFHGYLGDTSAYSGFVFGNDLTWQCDPLHPVGINPTGCLKDGHSIDGVLPEEMRRGASFQWPPIYTGYAWEALQGALVQAEILNRAGYPTWEWQDKALLRAVKFLYSIDWKPEGDDEGLVWVINHAYGTDYPAALPARHGKNIGWTDWTHAAP